MVLIVLKNETSLTKGHVFLASVIQHARVHLGVFVAKKGEKKKTTSGKFDKRFERLCKANQWRYLVENVKTEGFLTHVNWSVAETTGT